MSGARRMAVISVERAAEALAPFEHPQVRIAADAHGRMTIVIEAVDDASLDRIEAELVDPWLGGAAAVRWRGDRLRAAAPDPAEVCARFVAEVIAAGEAWGLRDRTWARSRAAGEREALPLWPSREHAARCIAGAWATFVPRPIALAELREQWLPGMVEDGIAVVVTPPDVDSGAVIDPEALAHAFDHAIART